MAGAIEGVPALGGGGGGAVSSVNTRTGAVVLTAADVGAGQLPAGVLLDSGIIIPSGADISGVLGTSGSKAAAGNDARLTDARTPTAHKTSHEPGGTDALTLLDNSSIKAAAGIVLSKLATDPLARANHTGTQLMATISDAGALATKSAVASADITDGTIVNADINAAAAIAYAKLALTGAILNADLAGSITAAKISASLDQFTAPAADVSMNTHKVTNVVDPVADQDAVTKKFLDNTEGQPQFNALLASNVNVDAGIQNASGALTSGTKYVMRLKVREAAVSGTRTVHYGVSGAGTSLTSAQNLIAVYNSSGTQLGSTSADQSTPFASVGGDKQATVGTFALAVGDIIYVEFLAVFTGTAVQFLGVGTTGAQMLNAGLSGANFRVSTNGTAATTVDASITPANLLNNGTARLITVYVS